jgi:TPR repeat protein
MPDNIPLLETLRIKAKNNEKGAIETLYEILKERTSEKNYEGAIKWFNESVQEGEGETQFMLSHYVKDEEEELWFLKSASDKEHDESQLYLGLTYRNKEDFDSALFWFTVLYENKKAGFMRYEAARHIAELFIKRASSWKDFVNAIEWYKKATELGDSLSPYYLGKIYEVSLKGKTNTDEMPGEYYKLNYKDKEEAAKWYLKSAEAEYEDAQYLCANLFFNGRGVIRNYAKSYHWMLRVACSNPRRFGKGLVKYYKEGIGCEESVYEAYVWALMAEADLGAQELIDLESKLSKQEILDAQDEAEYRISLSNEFQSAKNLYNYIVSNQKTLDGERKIDQKEISDTGKCNTKLHRSGIELSGWNVKKIGDIKLVFYLTDANITLSYKKSHTITKPADVLFSKNSLRLLIAAYDYFKQGHPIISYKGISIDTKANPMENHKVVTYFNSDFRLLFGLSKKDQAFSWSKEKFTKTLVANFDLEIV